MIDVAMNTDQVVNWIWCIQLGVCRIWCIGITQVVMAHPRGPFTNVAPQADVSKEMGTLHSRLGV